LSALILKEIVLGDARDILPCQPHSFQHTRKVVREPQVGLVVAGVRR